LFVKLVLVAIALLAIGAWSAPVRAAAGATTMEAISVGGLTRTYRLHRSTGIEGAAPLVVMLHGGFGSGQQAERSYGWDELADKEGFVVAYPDGLNRAWNAGGGCCGKPAADGVDDVGFITAMIGQIESSVKIDPKRIYAAGISNGGIMAYRLACETNLFAAIGPDSATMLVDCADAQPISVIHIHGLADTRIPFMGGRGEGVAHIDGPPVPSVIESWRAIDSCGAANVTTSGDVTTSIANCADARAVELITIAGAGHQWPGAAKKPAIQALLGADPPSTALDATAVIWRFFAAHPKP
jgi:polyhydroxybutyrate depolymerase